MAYLLIADRNKALSLALIFFYRFYHSNWLWNSVVGTGERRTQGWESNPGGLRYWKYFSFSCRQQEHSVAPGDLLVHSPSHKHISSCCGTKGWGLVMALIMSGWWLDLRISKVFSNQNHSVIYKWVVPLPVAELDLGSTGSSEIPLTWRSQSHHSLSVFIGIKITFLYFLHSNLSKKNWQQI